MRLIQTNWLHPTGFLPADSMHKFGQGVSDLVMLAALALATGVFQLARTNNAPSPTILSDMDSEIAALERRRDKTRAIKKDLMQQLLSVQVRLVKPDLDRTGS